MRTRSIATLTLFALVALAVQATAQSGAVLVNPSFEDGWHIQGAPELTLPNGWTVEYRDGDHPWCEPPCFRPEVTPNEEYVTAGQYSIRAFPPAFSRALFGIWQEQSVTPGSWWTFSCDARLESKPPGEMAAFVGIQPWGAGLFERQMVWGKETQIRLEWQRVSVTAQAYGTRIRVAMGANNKWATQNNTVWYDNCSLVRADGPAPQPTPQPPQIPPTPQPCPTCTPGGSCDVDYSRIEQLIADRPPVVWPR